MHRAVLTGLLYNTRRFPGTSEVIRMISIDEKRVSGTEQSRSKLLEREKKEPINTKKKKKKN